MPPSIEVRRSDDDELLGYVAEGTDGTWIAQAVFGGTLGILPTMAAARALVESDGLASLSRRWFHRSRDGGGWEVVVIQEAWPGRAVVVIGPYSLPGVPTIEITTERLAAGDEMTLEPPPDDPDLAQFVTLRG